MTTNTNVSAIESWGRCWVVVTGASRGFGASICKILAPQLGPGSVIVGFARDVNGLQKTGVSVKHATSKVTFIPESIDLSLTSEEEFQKVLKKSVSLQTTFDHAVIFHNAGSLGDLHYLRDISDKKKIDAFYSLNISSTICLNNAFLQISRGLLCRPKVHIVNLSSLCAIQPMKSWGLYCSSKAARDMLFKVLALEEQDLTVLSYSPGPLNNNMQVEARTLTADPELREMFSKLNEEGKLLEVEDSVNKMISILSSGKYQSGSHVDYYDIE